MCKDERTERFMQFLTAAMNGERKHSDRLLVAALDIALQEGLPKPLKDSLLLMTTFRYGDVDGGAMQVSLNPENGGIALTIDLRYMDALMSVGQRIYQTEAPKLLEHELAHLLLGHLDGSPQEFTDPMMILAKEVSVNDGWLAVKDTVYPFVCMDRLGIRERLEAYAKEQRYPKDWLQRYVLVYRALVQTGGAAAVTSKSRVDEWVKQWGVSDKDVNDNTQHLPDDAEVLVVYDGEQVHIYPVQRLDHTASPQDQQLMKRLHDVARDVLLGDGRYQYDATEGAFRYSPQGFSESERVLRFKGYRVEWHRIKRLFGVRRMLGYDRHRGHLYPPDEAPLVTEHTVRKTVYVFYDSSGSVPDEVLSGFVGTMRRSPFRIKEFYFSTQVSDKPHTGGTDFSCIERFILEQGEYPDTVVVLTDGEDYGPEFKPKYPERWHWIVYGRTDIPRKVGGEVIQITDVESPF